MMDVISERIGAMIESVRSRDENEILEGKLQRPQKMEAIGIATRDALENRPTEPVVNA
tara:strand:- start:1958 stop:2131 length:174 start_codon:yes stop_codon:yes gene_type:complete